MNEWGTLSELPPPALGKDLNSFMDDPYIKIYKLDLESSQDSAQLIINNSIYKLQCVMLIYVAVQRDKGKKWWVDFQSTKNLKFLS